jgi:hypothetical protein
MRMLPLERGGEFARSLEACRRGALALYEALREDDPLYSAGRPRARHRGGGNSREARVRSVGAARAVFSPPPAKQDLHLALGDLSSGAWRSRCRPVAEWDEDHIHLPSCLL